MVYLGPADLAANAEAGEEASDTARLLSRLVRRPSMTAHSFFVTSGSEQNSCDVVITAHRTSSEENVLYSFAQADVIIVRPAEHAQLIDIAEHARSPVINAGTDCDTPCQARSDLCLYTFLAFSHQLPCPLRWPCMSHPVSMTSILCTPGQHGCCDSNSQEAHFLPKPYQVVHTSQLPQTRWWSRAQLPPSPSAGAG